MTPREEDAARAVSILIDDPDHPTRNGEASVAFERRFARCDAAQHALLVRKNDAQVLRPHFTRVDRSYVELPRGRRLGNLLQQRRATRARRERFGPLLRCAKFRHVGDRMRLGASSTESERTQREGGAQPRRWPPLTAPAPASVEEQQRCRHNEQRGDCQAELSIHCHFASEVYYESPVASDGPTARTE